MSDVLTGEDRIEAVRARLAAGMFPAQIARETGLRREQVFRTMAKAGLRAHTDGRAAAATWRDAVADMRPDEAVDHLAWLLDEITWRPELGREPLPGLVLRPMECKLLAVLHAAGGRVVPKRAALAALYDDRPGGETPDAKLLDVFVCHLRRRLAGTGVEIVTHWGEGWSLRLAPGVALWISRR